MILSMKPLSLAEVQSYIDKDQEKKPIHEYVSRYCKLSLDKARSLAEDVRALKNVKISEEHIVKIVDFLPRDSEDVHKIFHDISVDDSEVNAILDVVKNY